MKTLTSTVAILALGGQAALAGALTPPVAEPEPVAPVIVEEEGLIGGLGTGGVIAGGLLLAGVVAAIAGSDDDDDDDDTPDTPSTPATPNGNGDDNDSD